MVLEKIATFNKIGASEGLNITTILVGPLFLRIVIASLFKHLQCNENGHVRVYSPSISREMSLDVASRWSKNVKSPLMREHFSSSP